MCEERDLKLTGVKGIFGPLMSEYVFCYILLFERKVLQKVENQAKKKWDGTLPGRLPDRTLGIIGLGSIGRHVASTAKHFGMEVWGLTKNQARVENVDELFSFDREEDFFTGPDYFVAALPDVPATCNILDARAFSRMKNTAVIINIGRGNALDEGALEHALQNGEIGGAALDVFRKEPLPTGHPFWDAPNLHITSHTAAPTFPEDVLPILIDNFSRFDTGQELSYLIDYEKGY
jgi:phosphoglycerate dehydrogenase-like enzyme